jgi:conjugative relaxase-like TrwC/TraI family protein
MLTVSKLNNANYYLRQCQTSTQAFDRTQPGEPTGIWLGSAPPSLGLPEMVKAKHLRLLLDGKDIYGETLVKDHSNRVAGWDLVFAAPKSVSLLWAIAPENVQNQIEALHTQAMTKAIIWLESQTYSRRGADGSDRQPIKLAIAAFGHSTNQDGQPHLHHHCLVPNIGLGYGFTGAIDSTTLYRYQKAAGALYRAEYAAKLESELGLTIRRTEQSFEIEPFSRTKRIYRSLMDTLSSRRVAIEQQQPKDPSEAAQIAKVTRSTNKDLRSRQEVCEQTRLLASRYGVTQKHIERLIQPGRESGRLRSRWNEWKCLREARTDVVRFQSHFSKRDLVCSLAQSSQGKGINAARILELAETVLASRYVRSLGEHRGEQRFTTHRMYKQEQSLMRSIEKIQSRSPILVRSRIIADSIQHYGLSEEQGQCLKHLCQSPSGLKVLTGLSGSGKTQVVASLSDALIRAGYQVVTVSNFPQSLSDRMLQTRSLLLSLLKEKPQHFTVGQLLWRLEQGQISLSRSSVVVIDDAHRLSLPQMSSLMAAVERSKAKLVLSGDRQVPQLSGAFQAISRSHPSVQLKELHRQVHECDRTMIQNIADNKAMRSLMDLAERNQLAIHSNRRDAISAIVQQWGEHAVHDFLNHRIIVDSAQVACEVNQSAQVFLRKQGVLQGTPMQVGACLIHVGDRIRFEHNQQLDGIRKGDAGVVTKLNKLMRTAIVQLDSGDRRVVSLAATKGIALDYAVRATQIGVSTTHTYVLTKGIGKETTLAQVTQFRERLHLHSWRVDALLMRELAQDMNVGREQKLAIEVEQSRL